MIAPTGLASAQPGNDRQYRCLKKRTLHTGISASRICSIDSLPSSIGSSDLPIRKLRQSNRNTVIINNTLYHPSFLHKDNAYDNLKSMSKGNVKVWGRKLRKKSLLPGSENATQSGMVIPYQLISDYFEVEKVSRETTLSHISTLSASRSQRGDAGSCKIGANIKEQEGITRSTDKCHPLSSHLLMVPKENADSLRPKVGTRSLGTIPTIVANTTPHQKERLERSQNRRVIFADNSKTPCETRERLQDELRNAIAKCDTLERILDRVYEDRDALKEKLEETAAVQEVLEKEVLGLGKRLQDLDTEANADLVSFDDEIARGRLYEGEKYQLRNESQRMQAGALGPSHDISQAHIVKEPRTRTNITITRSFESDRQMKNVCKEPPDVDILSDKILQKRYADHTLHEMPHNRFENEIDYYRHGFCDLLNRSRKVAESLGDYSSSDVLLTNASRQIDLLHAEPIIEANLAAYEMFDMNSNKTLQTQNCSIRTDLVDNNPSYCARSISEQSTTEQEVLRSTIQASTQSLKQLLEPDQHRRFNDKNAEIDVWEKDVSLHSSHGRIDKMPPVHRIRITPECEQADLETCLILKLNNWEWSSIPDLRLWEQELGIENWSVRGE